MQLIARLILVAVLAVFAVSSIAHAAGSAAMTADMVVSDIATKDMADCEACTDPESGTMGLSCDFVCSAAGLAAVLAQQCDAIVLAPGKAAMSLVACDFYGLTSSPAKQPPRFLI